MRTVIKKINEDKVCGIQRCIGEIFTGFNKEEDIGYGELTLYHYTPFEKLFSMLSGDALWASRSRFSNDSTEDEMIGKELLEKEQYYSDNYILCFCKKNDILSQWRGYCPKGGASIGFKFPAGMSTYSLLHANYSEDSAKHSCDFELYQNRPFPVIYCKTNSMQNGIPVNDLMNSFKDKKIKDTGCVLYDIAPYLKNGYFEEERELRLVFNNSDGAIENCVQFRKLDDGSMVPYIVVKCGNINNRGRSLSHTYNEDAIKELFKQSLESRNTILIPNGRDQSVIYNSLFAKITDHKKEIHKDSGKVAERRRWETNPLRIVCEGHLPVVSITVSPSPQQEYMKEVIERFCRSKYWLKNVEVNCSKIPYVAPKL